MNNIYKEVGNKLSLPSKVIESVYKAYWKFIRIKIEELDLKKGITEQQFNNIITSFNLPRLGKLGVTYDKYIKVTRKNKHVVYEIKYKED